MTIPDPVLTRWQYYLAKARLSRERRQMDPSDVENSFIRQGLL